MFILKSYIFLGNRIKINPLEISMHNLLETQKTFLLKSLTMTFKTEMFCIF